MVPQPQGIGYGGFRRKLASPHATPNRPAGPLRRYVRFRANFASDGMTGLGRVADWRLPTPELPFGEAATPSDPAAFTYCSTTTASTSNNMVSMASFGTGTRVCAGNLSPNMAMTFRVSIPSFAMSWSTT